MEYRDIGRTGRKASVIGLGCEHLDGKPYETVEETIHAALDAGVNIMDVFMPGAEIRQNIGRALKGRRSDVMLQGHIGSVDLKKQYDISRDVDTCKRYFNDLLTQLDTDYIDFGMLFFIDDEKAFDAVFNGGIAAWAQQLKKEGTVRGIGFSSHNPVIAARVVETGVPEMMLFSINPAFDMMPASVDALDAFAENSAEAELVGIDPARAHLYRLCQQKEVGITVMKTLGGGKLLTAEQSPFGRALTPAQCIHYALSRPAVSSCLVGCASAKQMRDTVRYLELPDAEKDYATVLAGVQQTMKAGCVYCNHCLPCPAGIDIAAVHRYFDIAMLDETNIPPSIAMHYRQLEHHAGECIKCGSCEGKCPFSVPVMDNMDKANSLFGQ